MQVGVLGPLRVLIDGRPVPVRAAKQRVVLAALALQARRVVSAGALAEIIWDEAQPEDPGAAVRNYVMRLRRVLGPEGARVITRHRGYLLEASDDEVDALAFAAGCRAGGAAVRAGAWPRAAGVLDEAMALWRGDPLCDIPSDVLARTEAPRLERLRAAAAEWRAEAGLRLGRPDTRQGPGAPGGRQGLRPSATPDDLPRSHSSHSSPASPELGGPETAGAARQKAPC